VKQSCDRVGVIRNGQLVVEGTVEELRGRARLLVRADPLDRARQLVGEMHAVKQVQVSDGALVLATDTARAGEIARELVTNGVVVSEIRPVERSLEETFFELTAEEH
jgi:ABC-type multidrug transport system ATPase subunit